MDNGFEFAFIADPQIGLNHHILWGLNGPQSDRIRLERAVAWVNANDIDFVIFGGDQINLHDSDEQIDIFMACAKQLRVPYYTVYGNHELMDPAEGESTYCRRCGPGRFAFAHKGAFFLGLSSTHLRGQFGREPQQREWKYVREQFDACPADCSQRFVVMHHPLFAERPDEQEETYWNMPNRRELLDYFKAQQVTCLLTGHWQQDFDAVWDSLRMISSVGTSLPLNYPEELAFKAVRVFPGGWSVRRVSVERS